MKKSYSQIWNYLAGKLSTMEEEKLMDWIGQSERNAEFFNEVVHDFNEVYTPSQARNNNYHWYWAAASILLICFLSIWLFNPFHSDAPTKKFMLSDGSVVILTNDSKFQYDSISFEATKWIKIHGTGEISTTEKEHLLIETQNGYLMMDGNSSVQIQELQNNEMNVFVEKGNIRWFNPSATTEELAFVGGEKMTFKNDGKTVLLDNSLKTPKTFLIFDNYMNL